MAGFLLAVNTFAWFVFITNGDGRINADVIAWDIAFIDEESQTELLDIELEDYEHNEINVSDEYVGQCIDITDITKATLVKLLKEIMYV